MILRYSTSKTNEEMNGSLCLYSADLLTVPRFFREASKYIVSTFHNGNRGSLVIAFGVKCLSCEAISRTTEQ